MCNFNLFDKLCLCCSLEVGAFVLGWVEIIVDFSLFNWAILHAYDPPDDVIPSELSGSFFIIYKPLKLAIKIFF